MTGSTGRMGGGIRRPIRMVTTAAMVLLGGTFTLSALSSLAIRFLQSATDAKRKKIGIGCNVCRGTGFYLCRLCKGNSTIDWSPLHDPIVINPCVCPTCEGNRVQRCLNCLGKGYV